MTTQERGNVDVNYVITTTVTQQRLSSDMHGRQHTIFNSNIAAVICDARATLSAVSQSVSHEHLCFLRLLDMR